MASHGNNNDASSDSLVDILDKIVKGKIDANRRYVDEILVLLHEQNRDHFLAKFAKEMWEAEIATKEGDLERASHHRVMAETYKSIAEKAFAA